MLGDGFAFTAAHFPALLSPLPYDASLRPSILHPTVITPPNSCSRIREAEPCVQTRLAPSASLRLSKARFLLLSRPIHCVLDARPSDSAIGASSFPR
jgi:hypothetical protein